MSDNQSNGLGSKAQGPAIKTLTPGTTYAWCSCGQSTNQPWCNGAHRGSGQAARCLQSAESEKPVALCQLQENEESALLRRIARELKTGRQLVSWRLRTTL